MNRHTELPAGYERGKRLYENFQQRLKTSTYVSQSTICQTINGDLELNNTNMVQEWGDSLLIKDDDCYRIGSKNIGSLGVRGRSLKEYQMKQWMDENQLDVTCL